MFTLIININLLSRLTYVWDDTRLALLHHHNKCVSMRPRGGMFVWHIDVKKNKIKKSWVHTCNCKGSRYRVVIALSLEIMLRLISIYVCADVIFYYYHLLFNSISMYSFTNCVINQYYSKCFRSLRRVDLLDEFFASQSTSHKLFSCFYTCEWGMSPIESHRCPSLVGFIIQIRDSPCE